jgi:hypothetical protein
MRRAAPAVLVVLAVCQSPESGRVSGNAGADVGNRTTTVQMHGGSRMYSGTPCFLPRNQCPGPLPVSGLTTDFPPPR